MFQENTVSHSLIGLMRGSNWTMRGIASVVILTFGSLVTAPAVAAVKQEIKEIQWHKQEEGPGAKLSARLQAVRDHLATAGKKSLKGSSLADQRKELKADADALADLDKDTLDSFASVSKMIKDKHLPAVIQQRELAAEKHYKTEMAALRQGLDAVAQEKDDAKAQAKTKDVLDRLSKFQMERSAQKFDPKNMPNRSLKPDLTRVPHTTKKSFVEAGFVSNPRLMVATTASNFDYSQLPGASDPAYLAATTEVTLSPAIQAKAAELHNNPVEIYNWVRNNVQWQPTWGAVQDADLTLSAQRGNAFDISSLLIALLRASGIPARYVHGTINVPEAKFRNWVGGFQDINAAVNYASAGGIPVKSLVAGGKIVTVQMEHIWVEAAIDYIPSRGAVNKSADTWVPMDASYKQFTFQQGLDPIAIAGIDPNTLAQQFTASGTVDATNGYVSGLNPAILQNAQETAQTAVQNYITQNLPNATVGQVIGGSTIVSSASTVLSATHPYTVVVKGANYGTLPSQLEQSITFALGVDTLGDPENPITFPWPQLNNQQVILSFAPATSADQQALLSLIPSGQITDISQLPSSIPAYLIKVIPQLKANGSIVAAGSSMTLGQELTFVFTPNFAGRSSISNTYNVIAGSYLDVAVIAGNVGTQLLADLQGRIQKTTAILHSQDPGQIAALTRDNLLGDLFQSGISGYYSQYISGAFVSGLRQGGHHYLAGGVGSYGYEPQVDYTFGVPKDIHGGGIVLNVPIVNVIGHDGADKTASAYYALQIGILSSALEAAVPDQMFSTTTQPAQALSASTILGIASAAGQRTYEITQVNQGTVLPLIHHSVSVMHEIEDALSAGKIVITHTDDITASGWTGAGYVLFDPQTGDGAYKISGGENGGILPFLTGVAQGAAAMAMLIALTTALTGGLILFGAVFILTILVLLPIFLGAVGYGQRVFHTEQQQTCLDAGIPIGAEATALIAALKVGALDQALAVFFAAIGIDYGLKNHTTDLGKCFQ